MTAHPRHMVEASCQPLWEFRAGRWAQREALGKRGNCSNCMRKPAWVEANHTDSMQMPLGAVQGGQGQIRGDEGCRTRVSRLTQPEVAKEVSVG